MNAFKITQTHSRLAKILIEIKDKNGNLIPSDATEIRNQIFYPQSISDEERDNLKKRGKRGNASNASNSSNAPQKQEDDVKIAENDRSILYKMYVDKGEVFLIFLGVERSKKCSQYAVKLFVLITYAKQSTKTKTYFEITSWSW